MYLFNKELGTAVRNGSQGHNWLSLDNRHPLLVKKGREKSM